MYVLFSQSQPLKIPKDFKVMTSALANKVNMNNAKLNACKKVLQEVCQIFGVTEEFIINKTEEICCNEKL